MHILYIKNLFPLESKYFVVSKPCTLSMRLLVESLDLLIINIKVIIIQLKNYKINISIKSTKFQK